jgi:membrane-associated protein
MNLLDLLHNLSGTIIAFGYIGVFITVFAESGLLVGFFLPGDSLLFTVGILASQGLFNIYLLIGLAIVAAIAGDSLGYYIGHTFGPKLFNREDSWLFKKEYVTRTQEYFNTYGKRTIIIARFIPVVRTFTPVIAGIGNMKYKTFLSFNIIGGVVWAGGVLFLGYVLGNRIPGLEDHLDYIIIGIILMSFIPIGIDLLRKRMKH